jgi:DNA-binding PadR family transcriptional regulator
MLSRRLREKLTKENLWLYILSLLSERDMYGYELRDAITERFDFKPGTVTAYRVLYSLKVKGLVTTKEEKVSGRKRKYYHLTNKGLEQLDRGKSVLSDILKKL